MILLCRPLRLCQLLLSPYSGSFNAPMFCLVILISSVLHVPPFRPSSSFPKCRQNVVLEDLNGIAYAAPQQWPHTSASNAGRAGAVSAFACSEPIGRKDGTDNKSTGSESLKGLSSVDLRPANAKVNEILNRPTCPTV